jgi:hypothetical protein
MHTFYAFARLLDISLIFDPESVLEEESSASNIENRNFSVLAKDK